MPLLPLTAPDSFSRQSAQTPNTAQPNDPASYYLNQADVYYQASRFSHAIDSLNRYLALNPTDVRALNKRGAAKAGKKDYVGAIADYNQAIALNPGFYNAYLNRGNLWVYLGNFAKKMGQSGFAAQDYQLALNDYGKAVRLNPMNSAAFENRAELYSELGMHAEALRDKGAVIQLQKLKAPTRLGLPFCTPRVALILANDDYIGQENDLHGGPIHDAKSMASVLQRQGFYVMMGYDLTGPQMKERVGQFIDTLKQNPGAVSLVYYSGHGGSVNGNNYLIPTEYTGQMQPGFEQNSVSVDYLLQQLKFSNSYFNMIFLDACRTPLLDGSPTFRSGGGPALKQWETEPGPGLANTWIEYASRPKMPAIQDHNEGLYTKYLVQFMSQPNLSLKDVSMYTSYALESDPVAHRENQHARTQTDLSRTGEIAQKFSFTNHCPTPPPRLPLSGPSPPASLPAWQRAPQSAPLVSAQA